MKKLRLRKWVKVVLIGMVALSLLIFNNKKYEEAVSKCISSGNEYNYCVEGLK